MSSLPGLDLESFLLWEFDLVLDSPTQEDANVSASMAEALGKVARRPIVSPEDFQRVLAHFEPHRDTVEDGLSDFDEDTQSWRDYAPGVASRVPDEVWTEATKVMNEITGRDWKPLNVG